MKKVRPCKFTLEQIADATISEKQFEKVTEALGDDWKKKVALGIHLELTYEEVLGEIELCRNNWYEYGSQRFLVCTDNEADEEFDDYIDNYIEECVLPEIPERYHSYFDSKRFKESWDSDRGNCLASYDGEENDVRVDGTWYYIYRID
jgi:hypothetical protein